MKPTELTAGQTKNKSPNLTGGQKSPKLTDGASQAKPTQARLTKSKKIDVDFDGGNLTSDAGALLLQQVDRIIKLIERINQIIHDPRDPIYITHQQAHLIAQRIFAIALGYEDVNDHKTLRKDPALLAAIKNHLDESQALGSSSTLSRLENRITDEELAALSKLFVELFIESFDTPPEQIIIDVDATDDTIHGKQEGCHFNGFYDSYCFTPLYFFCGDQLLWAQLRSCNRSGAHGTRAIFHYLVTRIKKAWPNVEIVLRADAGFCGPKLLKYCDKNGCKYAIGIASNDVLKRLSTGIVDAAEMFFVDAGFNAQRNTAAHAKVPQEALQLFWEFEYRAGTWDRSRRIVVKAERLPDEKDFRGKANTRYVVTNLTGTPKELYKDDYCARGEMENRIKEQQRMMFADRTSCHEFLANRFRLFLSSSAYVLMETLRRTALRGTELEQAQCDTIRLKLFKIAGIVRESVRRIVFSLSSVCPFRKLWRQVFDRLRMASPSKPVAYLMGIDRLRVAGRVPSD